MKKVLLIGSVLGLTAVYFFMKKGNKDCNCPEVNCPDQELNSIPVTNGKCMKPFVNYYNGEKHIFTPPKRAMYPSKHILVPTYKNLTVEEYNKACSDNVSGNFASSDEWFGRK